MYLDTIKAMYNKPTANIILIGEKLRVLSLRLGRRQGCLFFPLLFTILLEVLAKQLGKKRNKRLQIGGKEVKLCT